jgi:RNA polymerase sigma-70 factor (ECF subfamily)
MEAARPGRLSDTDLASAVRAAQAGDQAAFSTLYRAVHPPLLRYLAVLVAGDAEDVASETWAQVLRDLGAFRGTGDGFRGWVATIGRHRAMDHLRSGRRRPAEPVPVDALGFLPGLHDTEREAAERISTAEAVALIATLPTDQAEAVLLRAVFGLDAGTAGQVMGKKPGAVRTAAYRGLKTLAGRLESGASR